MSNVGEQWMYSHHPGRPGCSQLSAGSAQLQCGLCEQPSAGDFCHTADTHTAGSSQGYGKNIYTSAVAHALPGFPVPDNANTTQHNLPQSTMYLCNETKQIPNPSFNGTGHNLHSCSYTEEPHWSVHTAKVSTCHQALTTTLFNTQVLGIVHP